MSVQLHLGDCVEVMRGLDDNSVDTCITDPPYGLGFMGKEWDTFDKSQFGIAGNEGENDLKVKKNFNVLPRYGSSRDLYNFTFEWASEVYRVLKPGALLLAFGGTRTYHRMVCAIEDAGFEIRDTIAWVYGSGFPKSYDISKGIDKQAGAERESLGRVKGRGTNSGESRYNWNNPDDKTDRTWYDATAPSTPEAQLWHGWGTALKPAFEPIVVAMKPLDGTFANNALTWGVAGLWIDGGRVKTDDNLNGGAYSPSVDGMSQNDVYGKYYKKPGEFNQPQGRFPANVILSYPEDEYELRDDTTPEQLRMLAEWFDENA